jgi:uncharacterized protein (TIGR02145 family)
MKKNDLNLKYFVLTAILLSSSGYAQTEIIGSQVWARTNLNVSVYRNGDLIPQVQNEDTWNKLTTGAWCYYNNDSSNGTKYGKLYNWYAVNDPRGLAPKGYHIPSEKEWSIINDYLGGIWYVGPKMKSTSGWAENGNGTNSSGFSGLPGGFRSYSIGESGHWWSSSEEDATNAFFYILGHDFDNLAQSSCSKTGGLSVRCLRDTILFSSSGYTQTVTIGSQVWTSTNLNVETYRNGDLIPQVKDKEAWGNLTTGAWCYYDNDSSNGTKYGKLYNWFAVNDPRGLAPKGYHIPTDAEWTTLTDYLGGENKAGIKMKSLRGWESYDVSGKGTNSSGFSGLPGGGRGYSGGFGTIGDGGNWWSSSDEGTDNSAWYRNLVSSDGNVSQHSNDRRVGFSVRCLRD